MTDAPPFTSTTGTLDLRVAGGEALTFKPRCVIVAGYTARDRDAAQRHIDELAEIGVAPPRRVPMFYVMATDVVTIADAIEIEGALTTGEAEPVLLCTGGTWYLGVGSDHTDRELETVDVGASKRACPKIVSSTVLEYAPLAGRWDQLALRSWTGEERLPYQDGLMGSLMTGEAILDELSERVDVDHEGLIVFCGTVPLIGGEFRPSPSFGAELVGADGKTLLECTYEVRRREQA